MTKGLEHRAVVGEGPEEGPDGPEREAFGRFFLPGPTEVRPEVLRAQVAPMIGHRGPHIRTLMAELQEGLRLLFRTERPVFVSTSSATGLMEAAVRNGAWGAPESSGDTPLLALVNGAFSERFAGIAEACGIGVERLEVPWGEAHDPGSVRERLAAGRHTAVTVVHSETSTGALNPLEEIASVVREHSDALLLVDSVTGVGGAPMETDLWGLDFALTGSQKALALPPGLAFGVASERMMERSAAAPAKGVYFDLQAFANQLGKLQTPNTPALSLLQALQVQLAAIREEGMEVRWERHAAMRDRCVEWVEGMREGSGLGFSVLAPEGRRSPTVTCVTLPEGMTGPAVVEGMRARGFVIGGGYGKLKERTIRIGHMGDHTLEELDLLLGALEEVVRELAGSDTSREAGQ